LCALVMTILALVTEKPIETVTANAGTWKRRAIPTIERMQLVSMKMLELQMFLVAVGRQHEFRRTFEVLLTADELAVGDVSLLTMCVHQLFAAFPTNHLMLMPSPPSPNPSPNEEAAVGPAPSTEAMDRLQSLIQLGHSTLNEMNKKKSSTAIPASVSSVRSSFAASQLPELIGEANQLLSSADELRGQINQGSSLSSSASVQEQVPTASSERAGNAVSFISTDSCHEDSKDATDKLRLAVREAYGTRDAAAAVLRNLSVELIGTPASKAILKSSSAVALRNAVYTAKCVSLASDMVLQTSSQTCRPAALSDLNDVIEATRQSFLQLQDCMKRNFPSDAELQRSRLIHNYSSVQLAQLLRTEVHSAKDLDVEVNDCVSQYYQQHEDLAMAKRKSQEQMATLRSVIDAANALDFDLTAKIHRVGSSSSAVLTTQELARHNSSTKKSNGNESTDGVIRHSTDSGLKRNDSNASFETAHSDDSVSFHSADGKSDDGIDYQDAVGEVGVLPARSTSRVVASVPMAAPQGNHGARRSISGETLRDFRQAINAAVALDSSHLRNVL
jgi:hypothetical protein